MIVAKKIAENGTETTCYFTTYEDARRNARLLPIGAELRIEVHQLGSKAPRIVRAFGRKKLQRSWNL